MALIAAVLSGVLNALSHPPFAFSLLAWFAWLPLLFVEVPSLQRRFGLGVLSGAVGNLILFWWIWPTCKAASVGFSTGLTGWLSLSIVLALFPGVFFALYGLFPPRGIRPFLAAAVWVALEHVQSYFLTGFPWGYPSQTQIHNLLFLQLASVTGAEGLSFFLIWMNASLALAARTKTVRRLFLPVGCLVFVLLFGVWRLKAGSSAIRPGPRVALLQGNIDQYQKWDRVYEKDIQTVYESLSKEAAAKGAEIIFWPEGSIPGWFPNEIRYRNWIERLAREIGVPQFIGSVSHRFGKDTNSLFQISSDGRIVGIYDKRHLVPFGEYVPFGQFMQRWFPYIGQLGVFDAGTKGKIFSAGRLRFAPTVCYEAIFPDLVRNSVREGADVILNVTNDGWFLQTGAPAQHYASSVLRAVELGRPFVRAANSGISAVIDPLGREVVRSPLNVRAVFMADLPLWPTGSKTLFYRFGRWWTYLCWVILLSWIALIYFFHVKRTRRTNSTSSK